MTKLSKKIIFKLIAVSVPIVFTILATAVTYYVQKSYEQTEQELIKKETEFVSFELSENLKQSIEARVNILEILARTRPDIFPSDQGYFNKIVKVVIDNLPGFYAINWIKPTGVITWINPHERNKAALNKNLLERQELAQYLIDSRDFKETKISQAVTLYQGPKGFAIYTPIFDGKIFKGWYNGVIDLNYLLDRFFEKRSIHSIAVSVRWKGYDGFTYRYGDSHNDYHELEFESEILGQKLLVTVNLRKGSDLRTRQERLGRIFHVIYLSIALIAIFTFYIIRTQFSLIKLNQILNRDKTLLNILVHDMATPLTIISENISRLKEKLKGTDYPEIDRIVRSSDRQKDLFVRVRSFHASNMGKIRLDMVPVSTRELIEETVSLLEDQIKAKQIQVKIDQPKNEIYCLTDRITAVNNVLSNVLGNAIKFSDEKSTITIRTSREKNWCFIEIEDHGTGIADEILENLFEPGEATTTKGTKGEAGTGLGMLQIKAFMDLYKGVIKIHTSSNGTRVRLCFKSTDIK